MEAEPDPEPKRRHLNWPRRVNTRVRGAGFSALVVLVEAVEDGGSGDSDCPRMPRVALEMDDPETL